MSNQLAWRTAAVVGFLGVSLGAFGAHGLEDMLTRNGTVEVWKTAVLYHLIHGVMLFLLAGRTPLRRGPYLCLLGGVVVFSGSLYLLAVTNVRGFGAITPIGGVAFLAGWLWLAVVGVGIGGGGKADAREP